MARIEMFQHPGSGKIRFKKQRNVEKEISRGHHMAILLKAKVEPAERIAKAMAPVKTGHYRDGIKGEVDFDVGGNEVSEEGFAEPGTLVGRLNAYDFKSHWIEFGTNPGAPTQTGGSPKGFPARAILRLAVEKTGLGVHWEHGRE